MHLMYTALKVYLVAALKGVCNLKCVGEDHVAIVLSVG